MDKINDKIKKHEMLCNMLNEIYAKKNHDYGDSFGESYKEWGITAAMVRLSDKWNRLKTLTKISEKERLVDDEKITDTILDMCNYLLMTYIEMTYEEDNEENKFDE